MESRVYIGEIADINKHQYKKTDLWQCIEYIDTGSVDSGVVNNLQILVPGVDKIPSRAKRKVKDQSIIYSTVRPNQKHFAILEEPKKNTLVSTGFAVIDCNKEKVVPRFLYYALTRPDVIKYFQGLAEQSVSTYPALNPGDIASFSLNIPDYETQQKIVGITESIDRKSDTNHRINDYLADICSVLFEKLTDGIVESTLLGDYLTISSGKRPPDKSSETSQDMNVPLIGASGQMGFTSKALMNDKALIIGRVGTHGVVQRIDFPCWPSDNTLVIKAKYYEHVYQLLKRVDYGSLNRGSTQPLISQGDIKSYKVPKISSEALKDFENKAAPLMNLYDRNVVENARLAELRDALLPKLMSGKIDVSGVGI